MADLHLLPLVEHDVAFDEPEVRARVWSERSATGHREWFWRLKINYDNPDHETWIESTILHGPYWTAQDAHKAAEDHLELL